MLLWLPTRHLAAFLLTVYALIVIPGPSVLFVVTRGVTFGRRAAVATVVGNSAGLATQLVLVSVGVGSLVTRSAAALETLTLLGAVYLMVLGAQTLRGHGGRLGPGPAAPLTPAGNARQGFVVGITNPKGLVIFVAFLPRFVDHSAGHATAQLLTLGIFCVAIALASDGAWAVAAGTAGRWLGGSEQRIARLRVVGGLTLIALGIALAVAGLAGAS